MKRFVTVAVMLLVAICSAFSATASQSSAEGRTELAIDGVSCGYVFNREGADSRTNVVTENPSATALAAKQIVDVTHAPITVEIAFPPPSPVLNWIDDLCANRKVRRTLRL